MGEEKCGKSWINNKSANKMKSEKQCTMKHTRIPDE